MTSSSNLLCTAFSALIGNRIRLIFLCSGYDAPAGSMQSICCYNFAILIYYDYYLLGCRERGMEPLKLWWFHVGYAKYKRDGAQEIKRIFEYHVKERGRILRKWLTLAMLAELVRLGQDIVARVDHKQDGEQPGATGSGVREPRVPLQPVLGGGAARPLPTPETSAYSFSQA